MGKAEKLPYTTKKCNYKCMNLPRLEAHFSLSFIFFSFNAQIAAFTNVFMNCEKLPLHEFYCSIRSTALLKEQNQPRAKQTGRPNYPLQE